MSPVPAIVLLSGGMDSATVLAHATQRGHLVHALTFDYGQRHKIEIEYANRLARRCGVASHHIVPLHFVASTMSALTSPMPVPKYSAVDALPPGIDVTYVPARNTIFLANALGLAELLSVGEIFVGATKEDIVGFPDCRQAFFRAFEAMANCALRETIEGRIRITIRTPLAELTKSQVIEYGLGLGVDYSLTHTCYDPAENGLACGRCGSCQKRREGFTTLGRVDPITYQDDATENR